MFENSPQPEQSEGGTQEQSQEVNEPQDQSGQGQPLVDLDQVEKFRFAGREWTPKDFQGAYMMQSDYSKKTQALAEERKYYDNLSHDLEAVKKNPSLAAQFRSVYPEKFHNYLGYVTPAQQQAQNYNQNRPEQQAPAQDPAFMERFTRIESELNERKIQAVEAELDAKFKTFSDKYPMADEEAVIARAQALIDKGEKLNDKIWDSLFKSVHDRYQGLADKHYSQKIKNQSQSNQRSKDVPSGGGIPGQAPKQARTIKEQTQMLMNSGELDNS